MLWWKGRQKMVTISEVMADRTAQTWEKTLTDMNNIDESFANARDLGYTRLNYARVTAVAKLAESYDSQDIYKVQLQSNGKLGVGLRDNASEDKVLDLSKYEEALDALKQQTDPEGYKKEQEEKKKQEEENLLSLTSTKLNIQVYMTKGNKQVLIADSTAEKGTPEREAMDAMLSGEYKATKGDYYFKITRNEDTTERNEEVSYALQVGMGENFKHDYVMTEQDSEDTKNKTESKIPLTTSTSSSSGLSSVNALEIQATKYQATAQMLEVGYQNMANIYSRNSKF